MQQAKAMRNPFTGKLFVILSQDGNGNFQLVSTHTTRAAMVANRRPGQLGFTLDGLAKKIKVWENLGEQRRDQVQRIEERIRAIQGDLKSALKDSNISEGSANALKARTADLVAELKTRRKEIQSKPMPNLEQLRRIYKTV